MHVKAWSFYCFLLCFYILATPSRAEFVISSAIVEFTASNPAQQDIEIASRSADNDYIVAEISEITAPGSITEQRITIDDPAQSRLLVTPDKTVLAGGGRRILRFVLLQPPDASEHIYRVAVKPVIRGVNNDGKLGLKVLIGYEVLVIIRPAMPHVAYTVKRDGTRLTVTNTGNTNVLFENGTQCATGENCPLPPVLRAYAGQTASITLPRDGAVDYVVWDGILSADKHIN